MSNKYYTIVYFPAAIGIRLYCSNIGFHSKSSIGVIFEPEFWNARKFDKLSEARERCKEARKLYGEHVYIQRHSENDNGVVETTITN